MSSSIKDDDDDRWGPKNAIDGLWSDSDGLLFQSKKAVFNVIATLA